MKRCRICNQTYSNEGIRFCRQDGAQLVEDDLPPTEIHSASLQFRVRLGMLDDLPFLRLMLIEAAGWRLAPDESERRGLLVNPHVRRYIDDWGRAGDVAVIAVQVPDNRSIGAAWFRLFRSPETGYGFVNEQTPELSIGVAKHARRRGVGAALMLELHETAFGRGYRALSLSVEKDNPAVRLYERCGYRVVGTVGNAWTMVADLALR